MIYMIIYYYILSWRRGQEQKQKEQEERRKKRKKTRLPTHDTPLDFRANGNVLDRLNFPCGLHFTQLHQINFFEWERF